MHSPIARRYARALLAAAEEQGETELALVELQRVAQAMDEVPALKRALVTPVLGREGRVALVEAFHKPLKLGALVLNLLKLLAERGRFTEFDGVLQAYQELADEKAGRLRGRLLSAMEIDDRHVRELEKGLSLLTTRVVKLDTAVDKTLIGGAVAQVGSMVYDGSLKTQLERLRQELKEA